MNDQHPSESASIFSKLFFGWSFSYFYDRYKNRIIDDSCPVVPVAQTSQQLGDDFEKVWNSESRQQKPSLWKVFYKIFHKKYLIYLISFAVNELGFKMIQPFLIAKILSNYDQNDKRYIYGCAIVFCNFSSVILGHWYYLKVHTLGLEVKTSCCSLIYRKSLRLAHAGKECTGQLANILSNDAKRFELAVMYLTQLPVAFLEVVLIVVWLYSTVDMTVIGGIVFMVIFVLLQVYLGKLAGKIRSETTNKTDKRMHILHEFLSGIALIKMCCWEKPFERKLEDARNSELNYLQKTSYIHALNNSFMLFMNRTGIFFCVLTYSIYYGKIDAAYIYSVTAFFSILRQVLTVYLPFGLNNFEETKISINRIRKFLVMEEIVTNTDEKLFITNYEQTLEDNEDEERKPMLVKPDEEQYRENEIQEIQNRSIENEIVYLVLDALEEIDETTSKEVKTLLVKNESQSKLSDSSAFEEIDNTLENTQVEVHQQMFDSNLLAEEVDQEIVLTTKSNEESSSIKSHEEFENTKQLNENNDNCEQRDVRIAYAHNEEPQSRYEEIEAIQTPAHARCELVLAFPHTQNIPESINFEDNDVEQDLPKIILENITVQFPPAMSTILHIVNFKAKLGDSIAITGDVGSGKTTFLQTILKEINFKGLIYLQGTCSYAPQESWLFPGTIRENILLDSDFIQEKYVEVLKICRLEADFKNLPEGDLTPILNDTLSGGQKTRVNFARALYKNADFYLIDDVFSSVDAKVGNEMFTSMLNYLKYKCVILVTNQEKYLQHFESVYEIIDRKLRKVEGRYYKLPPVLEFENTQQSQVANVMEGEKPLEKQKSHEKGNISYRMYTQYFTSGNEIYPFLLILILFILAQTSTSFVEYFLSFWINAQNIHEVNNLSYTYFYSFLIILLILFSIIRSVYFFRFTIRKSKYLHRKMFGQLMKSPLAFFQSNQLGEIQNRFAKDLGIVDENIPQIIITTLQITGVVVGSFLLIVILNPWNLLPTITIFAIFIYFRRIFLWTSRHLKRLELTSFGPILTHFNTTLHGLITIRSFKSSEFFVNKFNYLQDQHTAAFYSFLIANRAFAFWLDFICTLYMGFIVLTILLIDDIGSVGLAIAESLNLIGLLQFGVRQWSEMENRMTSIERVFEYCKLPIEDTNNYRPENWPLNGLIEYRNVNFSYFGPRVLANINCVFNSGEKIAIVGRTGAGKTSFVSLLFRLFDYEGQILIDDVDIVEISIDFLRSQISVIPQKPELCFESVRANLDPFDRYEDFELWNVLEKVQLKEVVQMTGLVSNLTKSDINLSTGQKQLLALARVLLNHNKILILDEANASVDDKTDKIIQEIIRENFQGCTLITIAHKLDSIMDYDRVMVIDEGAIIESGKPSQLMEDENSHFSNLVRGNGRTKMST